MQICSHNILGQLQLDEVWFCLLRHATKGADSPDHSRMHYDDFCQVWTCCKSTADSCVLWQSRQPLLLSRQPLTVETMLQAP